uniref:Uncharacterized protein n=1 Tax=Lotharella oceanica TaxID=641309 RepID=A0A7S2TU71_9EUKA|mmetsp:Transcript_30131/g.56303  ORF Transcript_30131/g.56303 Transcript_30131/m.56303 type:complete len:223 (+) Transcript_30131:51-719(+)
MPRELLRPEMLRIIQEALKTAKAYDKMARFLQYGSAYLLVAIFSGPSETNSMLAKIKNTTGSCRRILRWGKFIGVGLDINRKPKGWKEVCQVISDSSLALFYLVENLIYLAKVGILKLPKEQMATLTWISDFFWLFEVLPLVPKYAALLNDCDEKTSEEKRGNITRAFFLNSFDTLVAAHDLGIKPGVTTSTRHFLGTITSLLGLYSVYKAARKAAKDKATS